MNMRPSPAPVARAAPLPAPRIGFWLALSAVVLELVLPSNLLFVLGLDYAAPSFQGGSVFAKFHPATYLLVLASTAAQLETAGSPDSPLAIARRTPNLVLLLTMMLATSAFAMLSVGTSGTTVFIENYVTAGLLALVGAACRPAQRRLLGWVVVVVCVICAPLVLAENALQAHFIPYFVDGMILKDLPGQFRGAALFDHPLTAATITMMAIFLVAQGWRPASWRQSAARLAALALLGMAMIAYGGRTALVVTAAGEMALLVWAALRGLVAGRGAMRPVLLLLGTVAASALIAYVLIATTPIGERLANSFYLDDSAKIRDVQWQVLNLMDLRQLLFGVPLAEQPQLTFQIGLAYAFADIENFWLLTFVSLGAIGFILYLAGFLPFLAHLWRISPGWGRLLLVCTILVASTSNSLGRKDNLLVLLTASLLAASAGLVAPASEKPASDPAASSPPRIASPPRRRLILAASPSSPAARRLRPS